MLFEDTLDASYKAGEILPELMDACRPVILKTAKIHARRLGKPASYATSELVGPGFTKAWEVCTMYLLRPDLKYGQFEQYLFVCLINFYRRYTYGLTFLDTISTNDKKLVLTNFGDISVNDDVIYTDCDMPQIFLIYYGLEISILAREMIDLRFQGYTMDDVVHILGKPPATLYRELKVAREKFEKAYLDYYGKPVKASNSSRNFHEVGQSESENFC